jgi:DNA-binding HxlR family transcriptional regulator
MKISGLNSRSICPIASTLEIIGDRWTLLIIRDLMAGRSHFKEFECSPEKISTNILADRLSKLVGWGLIEKFSSSEVLGRQAYRLTALGETLRPVLEEISDWGLTYIEGSEKRIVANISR